MNQNNINNQIGNRIENSQNNIRNNLKRFRQILRYSVVTNKNDNS